MIFSSSAIILIASGAIGELAYKLGDLREHEFAALTERVLGAPPHQPVSARP